MPENQPWYEEDSFALGEAIALILRSGTTRVEMDLELPKKGKVYRVGNTIWVEIEGVFDDR